MRHDLLRLRELNARLKPDASSLVVPIIPTISMMEAAADARNVFEPGDRLGDWLLPEDEVAEAGELADHGLADRLGRKRSYELQVMSEIWAGCISGLREWSRKRGIEGSNAMVDGWFRPELDHCPEAGWPAERDQAMEEHRRHLAMRAGLPPFTHEELWIPHCDLAYVLPAPMRCASIMSMRAGQREFLMEYHLIGLDDVIDMDRLPFIPGYTIEHRFDDEERHRILAAAAWKAAAASVPMIGEDDVSMPLPPKSASVYLSRLGSHIHGLTKGIPDYYRTAPHQGLVFTAGSAIFELTARGPVLEAVFDDGGRSFRMAGMDFRLPQASDVLLNTIREMASMGTLRVGLVSPLKD